MPFFAAFMIFIILWYEGDRGDSFVPFSFMGACWNWLSPCPVSGRQLVPLEMKWIHYYLKAPYPKKKRKKKKRDVCMTFLQILFTLKCFRCPLLRKFSTRYVWLSLSLSGQPEHLQIQWCFCVVVFFFFLLCHEVVVPWIPTCGPLALACEKCGAWVRNRNETQVITPSDTIGPIPRGPEVSLSRIRSIK